MATLIQYSGNEKYRLGFSLKSFFPHFEHHNEMVLEEAKHVGEILAGFQSQKKSRLMERVHHLTNLLNFVTIWISLMATLYAELYEKHC